jgi:hypothetical protein
MYVGSLLFYQEFENWRIMRYTLHYVHRICIDKRFDDWIPRWEKIDFKTLREAREYLAIAGENAYIIDNVTKQKIKEL